jgi:hypothetical protein
MIGRIVANSNLVASSNLSTERVEGLMDQQFVKHSKKIWIIRAKQASRTTELHHESFKNLQTLSSNTHYHLKFTPSSRKLSNHARFNHESNNFNRKFLDVFLNSNTIPSCRNHSKIISTARQPSHFKQHKLIINLCATNDHQYVISHTLCHRPFPQ